VFQASVARGCLYRYLAPWRKRRSIRPNRFPRFPLRLQLFIYLFSHQALRGSQAARAIFGFWRIRTNIRTIFPPRFSYFLCQCLRVTANFQSPCDLEEPDTRSALRSPIVYSFPSISRLIFHSGLHLWHQDLASPRNFAWTTVVQKRSSIASKYSSSDSYCEIRSFPGTNQSSSLDVPQARSSRIRSSESCLQAHSRSQFYESL